VLKFPDEICELKYNPDFAVRGLHFDRGTGMMLKVDSFGQIQTDTVYHGHTLVPLRAVQQVPLVFSEDGHFC
jgi:hypothetical protein